MNPTQDLAIVTSVHNYGGYLEDWAASILALAIQPARVALFEHGSTDQSAAQVDDVAARLRQSGLDVRVEHHGTRLPFGAARNRAVALSAGLPWVMHFDADDLLMPHCLNDVAALAPRCDVVALGYERCGDLRAGPRQRRKVYKSSAGPSMLQNPTPASGLSPFRRSFWERSPYPEGMAGGWDTALWIGFAHLGARVLPTRRPCFWYRQHADSIFNTRRIASWPTAVVGNELQSRRRGDHGVSLLVPRAEDDGPHRAAAWAWLRKRYQTLRPSWEIVEGVALARPWQKGVALDAALAKCRGRVAIVADADVLVDLAVLDRAVALVHQGAPWVVPHQLVFRLNPTATEQLLGQDPATAPAPLLGPDQLCRTPYRGFAAGGILVVSRPMLAATGGIPHQFAGWGAEDEALAVIFDTLLGPHQRLQADLVHLWHPPQTGSKALAARANRVEFTKIRAFTGDPEGLWAFLRDPSTPSPRARGVATNDAAWRRQAWQERAEGLRAEMAHSLGDDRAAAVRARTREARLGTPRPTPPAPVNPPRKVGPLQFLTAAAAHLAERYGLTEDDLRRRVPLGTPVPMEVVRLAVLAKRGGPPPAKRPGGCGGCGKSKPVLLAPVPVVTPTEEPHP